MQTDMTKLTVIFRNFAKDPQNKSTNNDSVCNNTLLHAANIAEHIQLYIQILALCWTDLLGQSPYWRVFLCLLSCLYLIYFSTTILTTTLDEDLHAFFRPSQTSTLLLSERTVGLHAVGARIVNMRVLLDDQLQQLLHGNLTFWRLNFFFKF